MRKNNYNYYELIFRSEEDEEIENSMCVLGKRKPSIEEAKEFWREDCNLYCSEQDIKLTEIIEIDHEEAQGAFDMSNEMNLPIFE